MKSISAVITEIKGSEELQQKLAEAAKQNALAEFLKALGCEDTAEEFISAVRPASAELGDDDLDAVAGGANASEAVFSVITLGIGCVLAATVSASSGGVDEAHKAEGNLLCNR